jgi:hypothetical protein
MGLLKAEEVWRGILFENSNLCVTIDNEEKNQGI